MSQEDVALIHSPIHPRNVFFILLRVHVTTQEDVVPVVFPLQELFHLRRHTTHPEKIWSPLSSILSLPRPHDSTRSSDEVRFCASLRPEADS